MGGMCLLKHEMFLRALNPSGQEEQCVAVILGWLWQYFWTSGTTGLSVG